MADKHATAEAVCEKCGERILYLRDFGWMHCDTHGTPDHYATPRTQPSQTAEESGDVETLLKIVQWMANDPRNRNEEILRAHVEPFLSKPSQTELRIPRHAFEVRITIGGNDWDYVLRTLDEIAGHVREHGPECGLCSGGWGGSHSVDIEKRDVTPDAYREELEAWRIARLEGGR